MPKPTLIIDVKRTYSVKPFNLLTAREKAGLSQGELAGLLNGVWGWSQQSISRIEGQGPPHAVDLDIIEQFKQAGFKVQFSD